VKGVYLRFWIILCCWFFGTAQAHAQDVEKTPSKLEPFFIEVGALYYPFHFELFSGIMKPSFGFHGALGAEWQKLRLSLSFGYSKPSGADPLVEDIPYVYSLTGRIGWMWLRKEYWGIETDLGLGGHLSKTIHYETWLDFLADRPEESRQNKLFGEIRFLTFYIRPVDFLKFYAGVGGDVIFELKPPIFLPVLEAGVSFKPFAIRPPKKREPKAVDKEEVVIPVTPWRETIYFKADSGTEILQRSLHVLEEAGKRLKENPQAHITLRGYAAPKETIAGQDFISAARVWHCMKELKNKKIVEDRMHPESFGANETSDEMKNAEDDKRRRVEIIIE
jgi:hypothetical protein